MNRAREKSNHARIAAACEKRNDTRIAAACEKRNHARIAAARKPTRTGGRLNGKREGPIFMQSPAFTSGAMT
ncbi:MAG: hypothetical protein RBU27_04530 [Bacteroidota bacterium]|nr:hypothetical protein [Bacteroidota bacterium]